MSSEVVADEVGEQVGEQVPAPARARILIVDDLPQIVRAMTRALPGHDVVGLTDPSAALELLDRDAGFDLVLCDLMMSPMSGPELYARLVTHHPAIAARFVLMTTGAPPYLEDLLGQAPFPVVDKCCTSEALAVMVRRHLAELPRR